MFQSKPYKKIKNDVESILGKKSGTIALSNTAIARKNGGTYEIFLKMDDYVIDENLKSYERETPIKLSKKHLVQISESRILNIQTPYQVLDAAKKILHPMGEKSKWYDKPLKI